MVYFCNLLPNDERGDRLSVVDEIQRVSLSPCSYVILYDNKIFDQNNEKSRFCKTVQSWIWCISIMPIRLPITSNEFPITVHFKSHLFAFCIFRNQFFRPIYLTSVRSSFIPRFAHSSLFSRYTPSRLWINETIFFSSTLISLSDWFIDSWR